MANIGFIGIGYMGRQMSQRLLNAGHNITVFDLEKSHSQKVEGAEIASNPAQVAEGKDYLFTMLPFSDDTIEALIGEKGALTAAKPSCVFIDSGTSSPSLTWFLARRVKEDGFEFLDCPVSGSAKSAQEGELLIVGSGNRKVFENTKDIFKVLANKIHYLGEENGLGQLMILTLNCILGAGMALLAESVLFGEKAGLNRETILEVMADSSLMAPFMKEKIEKLSNEEFSADFQTYLMDKDLTYINEVAEHVKASMPINAASWQLYRSAITEGMDKQDYSSVFKVIEALSMGVETKKKAA